jgi:CheY-like chemotaxis protein
MNKGPVLVVDVDPEDRELLHDAWDELGFPNALIFLSNGDEVLQYLRSGNIPFLILCDVNIPRMDGFELKKQILEEPEMNFKSIPFVYWSNEASKAQIQKAYELGGNGFFVKDNTFHDMKQSLIDIVRYWRNSKTPY